VDEERLKPTDDELTESEPSETVQAEVNAAVEVHLEPGQQTRNLIIYGSLISLVYLVAPVLYVGILQASLFAELNTSDTLANIPSSCYLGMAWFPIVIAWMFPQVRLLKRTLSIAYTITAVMSAIVVATLLLPCPTWMVIAAVIVHATVLGGRGVSERRRGRAFQFAFGVGPIFAVIGSLVAQIILGNFFGRKLIDIPSPYNFAILYGACVPVMLVAAFLAQLYIIPLPKVEVQRKPFISGVFGGFGQFISYRLILYACIAYLLVYSGHMIMPTMNLYTKEVLGEAAANYAGYQMALRFGFKVLAGFLLGWVLLRSNPRSNLFLTTLFDIIGVIWVLSVRSKLFMLSFGIMGAGELFGAYYPYYVLCCSPKSQMRRNMAFVGLLSAPVGFAPALFGWISDTFSRTATFYTSLGILVFVFLWVALGRRPRRGDG